MSKKVFLLTFLLGLTFLSAKLVNGIAVIIENEPITIHEVYKAAQEFHTDEKTALNLLIKDRLEEAQIKNLKIEAGSYEVSQKLDKIAEENGVSKDGLRSLILSRGGDFMQFRDDVTKSIKQEKLYQNIFAEAKIKITPDMARAYFEQNQNQFLQFSQAKAIHYIAPKRELLEAIQSSPMSQNPAQLRTIFGQTKDGSFTQIFQTPNGFETFFVIKKSGETTVNFEDVQNEVMNALYRLEQDRVISEYFNKLRVKANIKVLR